MFGKFREIVDNRHDYAQDWKERTKGKILGYLCTYGAEELAYAAGNFRSAYSAVMNPRTLPIFISPGNSVSCVETVSPRASKADTSI